MQLNDLLSLLDYVCACALKPYVLAVGVLSRVVTYNVMVFWLIGM